jgi:OmcA/MtrC family decaheme c-type cytochrome
LERHSDPRYRQSAGLNLTITDVSGGSGSGGAFLPGDTITVAFSLLDDSGAVVDLSTLYNTDIMFSGPTDHYQVTIEGTYNELLYNAIWDEDDAVYRFSFSTPIPDTYPAQLNDTEDIGMEEGDWGGEPLVEGTYTVMLMGAELVISRGEYLFVPSGDTISVLVGENSTMDSRAVVQNENCQSCHVQLVAHGGVREGVDACLTCHTAGGEDRYSAVDASTTPGVSIHFPVLIHKLHNASKLSEPLEILGYPANPFGEGYPDYNVLVFDEVLFPRFDGGVQACESCHAGNDAWQQAQGPACLACHDTDAAAAHAAVNTDPVYGESCAVCHDADRDFPVAELHNWLR